jgi:hypothetical protein
MTSVSWSVIGGHGCPVGSPAFGQAGPQRYVGQLFGPGPGDISDAGPRDQVKRTMLTQRGVADVSD